MIRSLRRCIIWDELPWTHSLNQASRGNRAYLLTFISLYTNIPAFVQTFLSFASLYIKLYITVTRPREYMMNGTRYILLHCGEVYFIHNLNNVWVKDSVTTGGIKMKIKQVKSNIELKQIVCLL